MTIIWQIKQWLAVEHNIYRASQLKEHLAKNAGVQLSNEAIRHLLNGQPKAIRLSTLQALCTAFNCTSSEFFQVTPEPAQEVKKRLDLKKGKPSRLYGKDREEKQSKKNSFASPYEVEGISNHGRSHE